MSQALECRSYKKEPHHGCLLLQCPLATNNFLISSGVCGPSSEHVFDEFASKFNGNTTNEREFLEVGATLISVHIPLS